MVKCNICAGDNKWHGKPQTLNAKIFFHACNTLNSCATDIQKHIYETGNNSRKTKAIDTGKPLCLHTLPYSCNLPALQRRPGMGSCKFGHCYGLRPIRSQGYVAAQTILSKSITYYSSGSHFCRLSLSPTPVNRLPASKQNK